MQILCFIINGFDFETDRLRTRFNLLSTYIRFISKWKVCLRAPVPQWPPSACDKHRWCGNVKATSTNNVDAAIKLAVLPAPHFGLRLNRWRCCGCWWVFGMRYSRICVRPLSVIPQVESRGEYHRWHANDFNVFLYYLRSCTYIYVSIYNKGVKIFHLLKCRCLLKIKKKSWYAIESCLIVESDGLNDDCLI
jgi:hypothetical protein